MASASESKSTVSLGEEMAGGAAVEAAIHPKRSRSWVSSGAAS